LPQRVLQLVSGEMLDEDFLDAVGTVIAAKAILWQIVPPLSVLSIYCMNTANSPVHTAGIQDFELFVPNFFIANIIGSDSSDEVSFIL